MDQAPTYLVVVDDSPEAGAALRFAVLRAAHVGADVTLATVVAPTGFQQWGAVQSAMEAESLAEAQTLLEGVAAEAARLAGAAPRTVVLKGEAGPALNDFIRATPGIRALVLAAASKGAPGPLVSYFAGERAGQLPCILMIVPGGLDEERLQSLT